MSQIMDFQQQLDWPPGGPWIHTARELQERRKAHRRLEKDAYSLWWIDSGHVQIRQGQVQTVLKTPGMAFLSPGDGYELEIGKGATWCMVRFDMVWRPLQVVHRRSAITYNPLKNSNPQPSLSEYWGCTMPTQFSLNQIGDLREVLIRCTSLCMQGERQWLRANLILGQWLLDFRETLNGLRTKESTFRKQFEDVVRQHLRQPLTLQHIAALMGMTARNMNRRLRDGDPNTPSPKDIVQAIRLDMARRLLAIDNTPLKTIAELCGYRSVNVFILNFKKAEGVTPGAWRRDRSRHIKI